MVSGMPARRGRNRGETSTVRDASEKARYVLRLYVAGQTRKSLAAFENLLENPKLARGDQIFAVPTLVRKLPPPVKKIIGDLSNTERVLVGLDIRPHS